MDCATTFTPLILLCNGYLRKNMMVGYQDVAIILSKYVDLNVLILQLSNCYTTNNTQHVQFLFKDQLTLSTIIKTSINKLSMPDIEELEYKIFLESGIQLTEQSNIQELQNHDRLLITNEQEMEKYSYYISRGIKIWPDVVAAAWPANALRFTRDS